VPVGFAPGLEATSYNVTRGPATASGSHIVEVEVDIETGEITLLKYSVAHDCGRMLNPQLVEGQVLGGVVHGIGNALFERMHYDESGQPLSVNYGEYYLPLAAEMPPIEIAHQETLSPINPLGVKGAGEGGTLPAANAVISAIENALKPFGIVVNDYPVDPERICELLDEAEAATS
jgi:carbon-monoxide dehydrogenase large subunit